MPSDGRAHRPPSPLQVATRERNWTLKMVAGALGNLQNVRQKQRLSADSQADIDIAIKALERIDARRRDGNP